MIKDLKLLLKKEIIIEINSPLVFSGTIVFSIMSLLLIKFLTGGHLTDSHGKSALFWVIILFGSMLSLYHLFSREVENSTENFTRMNFNPTAVFFSRWIFNLIIVVSLLLIITPLYQSLFKLEVIHLKEYILSIFCGGVAIVSAMTFSGFLASRAFNRGMVFPLISFPVLFPPLWGAATGFSKAIAATAYDYNIIIFLIAYSTALTATSLLLFEKLWLEQ